MCNKFNEFKLSSFNSGRLSDFPEVVSLLPHIIFTQPVNIFF